MRGFNRRKHIFDYCREFVAVCRKYEQIEHLELEFWLLLFPTTIARYDNCLCYNHIHINNIYTSRLFFKLFKEKITFFIGNEFTGIEI